MPEKKEFSRLPNNVIPSVYDLKLQPNLSTFIFEGEEIITLQVGYFFILNFYVLYLFNISLEVVKVTIDQYKVCGTHVKVDSIYDYFI